ncbi:hypothetical protein E3983_02740 [Legionella israelensis]|uniref:Uncharacterized protein n=1 Tax=Legionella israelensis TaxID=454 RepID=A0AAX1EEC0_9GAMM|nr:hypothetical protein [Legionella israelensis]QBR83377.1 hypothetical protein E3983_02740 [Legionella israelensis]
MSDFYDDDELLDIEDEFANADIETTSKESLRTGQDARRRLESLLEEKRLRDELDDFVDY